MTYFFKLLIAFQLLFFVQKSTAQDKWTTLDYQTTNTGDNGLIGQFVMAFLEDHQQRIWIGTESGISIKDGNNWTSLTKSDGLLVNEVKYLIEGKDSSIWIGYESYLIGISRYKNGEFIHYNTNNVLLHDKVECIFKDNKDNIWVANGGGLNMFDGKSWHDYTASDGYSTSSPTSIAEDQNGNIWIGTSGDGIWLFNGNEFSKVPTPSSLSGLVRDIFCDSKNRIWAYASGVHVYENSWTKLNPPGNSFGVVWDINQDQDSIVYLCSSAGVYTIDKNFNISHYTTQQGIPHDNVLVSYEIDDIMHIGTEDGYAYFDGVSWFSNLTSENGLIHNDVNDIFKDSKGNLWFCTQGGISRFDGIIWKSYRKTPNGNIIEWVKSGLEDKDGNFWFTTVHGIFKLNGDEWTIFDYKIDEMFSGWGQDILEDDDGNIWVATFNYLLRFDGNEWFHYNDTSGFISNHLDGIFKDSSGNIWIGSRSQITKWDGNNFIHDSPQVIYKNEELAIYSFIEDKEGSIIASTHFGCFIYNNEAWDNFQGLSSDWYFDSFIDNNEIMWFGTISGLVKYDGSLYELFNIDDGLSGNIVKSIYRDELTGELWIGTDQGITHIIPDIEVTDIYLSNSYLRISTDGISQPYHFSIDGNNFDNESGEFNLQNEEEFDLYITNSYDTLSYSNVRSRMITGMADDDLDQIKVFPNPSNGIYQVNKKGRIRVVDLKGNIVFTGYNNSDSYQINISHKPSGLYFIQIVQNNSIENYKVLKE